MSKVINSSAPTLFPHPFSKAYWVQAASEFKKTKILVFAALMIALRVVMKMVSIPIGVDMRINTAFIVNAFGAAVFGPVVSIVAAAITDTLGCILFPTGVYFFPFIFVEIAGSLFYALCFYRAELSFKRIILATFLINFGVNIVINTPLMMLYYELIMGKYYAPFDMVRIIKNLVEITPECIILMFVFRATIPSVKKLGFVTGGIEKLRFTKRHVALLAVLLVIAASTVFAFSVYTYNTSSLSADYTKTERLEKNMSMIPVVTENNESLAGETVVTVIESAIPKFMDPNITYSVAVYTVDQAEFEANVAEELAKNAESTYGMDTLNGYSKSKAKADDALVSKGYATIVMDKNTGAVVSYEDDFE